MAIIFQDGFDHYGTDKSRMLQDSWVQVDGNMSPTFPSFGARTGVGAFLLAPGGGAGNEARVSLPSTYSELYFSFGYYTVQLPTGNNNQELSLRDALNSEVGSIWFQSNGSIRVNNAAGTQLGVSPANSLGAGVWQQVEIRWQVHASTAAIEVRVEGETVLSLTNQNTGSTNIGQFCFEARNTTNLHDMHIDDLVVNDTSGDYNTGFLGTVRVAAIYPRLDDETGWTAYRRHKFGNGICEFNGSNGALTAADNAQLELGSGDFTLECFARWLGLPSASNRHVMFAKWREDTNERSFRFFLGGASVNNGHLQFDMSTDGTAGTVATIASSAFEPVLDKWYHIAVQRDSGELVIFVDGVPYNAPEADANTYHDNTSLFAIGGQQDGANSIVSGSGFSGFLEEVRVTKGVARYNKTGFTPPSAAFGRNVGADPDFASVSLLMGFDTALTDESSFGRAITSRNGAGRFAVDDFPPDQFNTVNQTVPRDDTGIEAPFIAATNVLTFTGQPANDDTVTVDSNVYTFKAALSGGGSTPGEVLIGASVNDSIDNLVAAINGDAGAGTLYGTGTASSDDASALNIDNDQMRVTANTPGTAGNAVTATESCANAAWADTGGTLVGGLDIPGPSSFFLTRLPAQTTGIKAIRMIARAKKSDSGPAKIQMSFVTADDSSANGVEHSLATSTGNYSDIVEEDPSTTNGLTPASFIGARLRVDRTE